MLRSISLFYLAFMAAAVPAWAQDAVRGAGLYLQLPGAVATCVSCHGPDPAVNRNNLLRAAGQPAVLLKALNAVGVMGYLKPALADADIADLAAYLDTVARAAADSRSTVWPRHIEFGDLGVGAASPEHGVWLRNLSTQALTNVAPRVVGGRFLLQHDCPATLAPGAACMAGVRALAPLAGVDVSDAIVWGGGSALVVGLSARGTALPVASLVVDGALLDFGAAEIGATVLRRFSLRNAGSADATLGVATLTGPTAAAFTANSACAAGTVLMPGMACTLEVQWRAGAAVAYEASLQWRSDGTNPAPVRLQAQGQAAPLPAPPASPPVGGGGVDSGGGGGCAAAPPGWRSDASLALWAVLAAALLARRRRRARQVWMTGR
jgi:cytochrome c553